MSRGNVGVKKREIAQLVGSEESDLRDMFAIAYLTGIVAQPNINTVNMQEIARTAYLMADAMLDARNG